MTIDRRRLLLGAAVAPLVRHARAADVPRFALGVASGCPRADGVVLWTRLTGEALPARVDVQWELAHDEAFTRIAARGSAPAEAAWAHSVHAEPAGLEPARWYWYRFRALGAQSASGRTRTAPAPGADATLDAALASCQRFDAGHYAAWRHVADEGLDLVLFVGDYIYESASSQRALRRHAGGRALTLDEYRARYAQYRDDPALQAAHAACPWLVAWDDHELENDYAGTAATTLRGLSMAAQRAAAYQAWWEHLPLPMAMRPRAGALRMHGRLDWGRLARIHLLDDRQHRDVQACLGEGTTGAGSVDGATCAALADPRRSLLGRDQEDWLAAGWDLQRPWNLVAQQTLMARATTPAGRVWTDGWDGYPAARQRLLDTVAARRVGGVVVLGGDVHANVVADLKADWDDPRAPVVASEFCGTSISSTSGWSDDAIRAVLRHHGHLRHARADERGYTVLTVRPQRLQARLMAVDDALRPDSGVHVQARFAVDPRQPGPQAD